MTRFREEVYAKKAYKAEVSRRRKGTESAVEADRRASRVQYLKKPSSVRKAIYKVEQAKLNGF